MSSGNSSTSSLINTSTIIAIVSTTALIYTQWSNVPEWIRFGLLRGGSKNKKEDSSDLITDANDDLANLPAVLGKLNEMMSIVKKATSSESSTTTNARDVMTEMQMMAAFYSLLHLHKELWAMDEDYRDKQYDDDREHDDVKSLKEVRELAEYLEYATWAYEECHDTIYKNCLKAGLDLITYDTATEPGRVGHYIALHHQRKLAIVGLKGTSTISDVLTDLIAIPREHVGCHFVDDESVSNQDSMRVHEGIFTAALWMADNIQPTIQNLFLPLNYKLVICGHSLGAGTACLLGLELRSRIKAFRQNYTDLRVLAFATPPVVSYGASKACAPFVTSVVNNADVVPRASVANLIVMNKLLIKVNEKLNAKGLALDSWTSLSKYYSEHTTIDDDLLLSPEELDAFFEETHAAPENENDALFVPGRCVVMWDKGENDNNAVGAIVTDCGMKMLRQIELSLTLVTDHSVKGYRDNLKKVIEQLENTN